MSDINNDDHLNRGVEFLLNGGKKRKQPKTFHIIFEKVVRFLKREYTIYFEFSITKERKIP